MAVVGAAKDHLDRAAEGVHAEGNTIIVCGQLAVAISELAQAIEQIAIKVETLDAVVARIVPE